MAANREMEFCLLGPLLVRRGGEEMRVVPGLQRSLLAALLLRANTSVPVDELAEALWGCEPPRSARASMQNIVMRLRRSLADADRSRITAQPGGYRIRVEPGELDVERFEALREAARDAARAGSHADAVEWLRAASSLWRGEPLAGVPSELLAVREVPRLEEMRLQTTEARIDAELHLGGHAQVITELRHLVAANPLRERLHTLLMLALFRNGQRAEALAAYQSARSVLVGELGIEPGPQMRQIQQQILDDPVAAAAQSPGQANGQRGSTGPESRQPTVALPRQVPAAAPHFSGRSAELAALTDWADHANAGTVVISAIAGTAGIGKTALAVYWAHRCASRFPDGQLYINLHGFGPTGTPMAPAEAVRLLLDGLGMPPERIPADPQAREALYRSHLADRKILIILDNASDAAQVRPLLPASPGCMVLVTSRNQLLGLVAADGANLLTLDVLTEPEARQMLALRLTPGRVAAEPAAVTELIQLCARLPLALSIAAARAAGRPRLPLATLVAELRDTHARLDALETGDAATDMRTVLSWSCQQLPAPAVRMFRLLGLHPGPDITIPAAASLAGVCVPLAQQAIADLARAHLVTEHQPGRYSCHDLLRAYAAEQSRGHDSEQDRGAALHRVLDHYLHTAFAASLLLSYRIPITLSAPAPGVMPEELTDRRQALDWFGAERQVLLAAVEHAAGRGFDVHAWQLPWTTASFLDWFGYWHELAATQRSAPAAAERLGDRSGQAEALRYVARGHIRLGEDAEAITQLTAAIDLAAQAGNDVLQATALLDLGGVLESQGRIHEALARTEQARRLHRKAGHRWGEALALSAAGWSHSQLGNYRDALRFCGQALEILRELKIQLGQSATLDTLGYIHHQLGQYGEAIACFGEAMSIDGDADNQRVRAEILIHLGDSQQAAGNQQAARGAWQEALALLEELHQPDTDRVQSRLSRHPSLAGAPAPQRHAESAAPLGTSFKCGQPELELVDPVPEYFELGLVGQPPLRGAAQAWRGFSARGNERERYQPLRPVRAVD